jgi:hypothetical protein
MGPRFIYNQVVSWWEAAPQTLHIGLALNTYVLIAIQESPKRGKPFTSWIGISTKAAEALQ